MKTVLASAGSKNKLQKMINDFYYSENWIIDEENNLFNTKLNKFASGVKVENKGKRWRFVMIQPREQVKCKRTIKNKEL